MRKRKLSIKNNYKFEHRKNKKNYCNNDKKLLKAISFGKIYIKKRNSDNNGEFMMNSIQVFCNNHKLE